MLLRAIRGWRALTFPGFMMSNGSTARLIVHISSTVSTPSSSTRYSFFPTPTPCSPVPMALTQHFRRNWNFVLTVLTCPVQSDRTMHETMHGSLHSLQFVVILELDEGMEVS